MSLSIDILRLLSIFVIEPLIHFCMEQPKFVKAEVLASNGTVGTYQSGSAAFRIPNAYCDGHN